jgi:hypothetical protein
MPIIRVAHEAANLKVLAVPLACPMRWSAEGCHGHSQDGEMHLPVLADGHHPDDHPRMPVTDLPAVCAQTCGSLVRNGAEPVHTQWKCWGFRCLAATMTGPLPGRARVGPCAYRENQNYPHATPQ